MGKKLTPMDLRAMEIWRKFEEEPEPPHQKSATYYACEALRNMYPGVRLSFESLGYDTYRTYRNRNIRSRRKGAA